jgi:O-antigen/teichoic acid export membrane protein
MNKHAFIIYLVFGLDMIIALGTIPYILSTLGTELYAVWLIIFGLSGLYQILELGIPTYLIGKYTGRNVKKGLVLVRAVSPLLFALLFVFLLPNVIFLHYITSVNAVENSVAVSLGLSVVVMLQVMSNFSEAAMVINNQAYRARLYFLPAIVLQLFTLISLLMLGYGIMSIVLSLIVRFSVIFGLQLPSVLLAIRSVDVVPFYRKVILAKGLLKVVSITLPSKASEVGVRSVEAFFLNIIFGSSFVAYVLINKIFTSIRTLFDRIGFIILPRASHMFAKGGEEIEKGVSFFMKYTMIVLLFFLITAIFSESILNVWMGDGFFLGHSYVFAISIIVFLGYINGLMNYLFASVKKIAIGARLVILTNIGTFSLLVFGYITKELDMFIALTLMFNVYMFIRILTTWKRSSLI